MPNSPLIDCIKLTSNHGGTKNHAIDTITPHCFVGQVNVETGLEVFQKKSKQASCNYVIGKDGRLGLCVDETNRSWCSSNRANDDRAITIECASDSTPPYKMNNAVYEKLCDLCYDICKRYNKTKLIWFGDKTKTLSYVPQENEIIITVHRWFANKSCPGDWLYERLDDLAKRVTEKLKTDNPKIIYKVQVGAYKLQRNANNQKAKLLKMGFDCFVTQVGEYFKVQVGAFSNKKSALELQFKLKGLGFSCIIITTTMQQNN